MPGRRNCRSMDDPGVHARSGARVFRQFRIPGISPWPPNVGTHKTCLVTPATKRAARDSQRKALTHFPSAPYSSYSRQSLLNFHAGRNVVFTRNGPGWSGYEDHGDYSDRPRGNSYYGLNRRGLLVAGTELSACVGKALASVHLLGRSDPARSAVSRWTIVLLGESCSLTVSLSCDYTM